MSTVQGECQHGIFEEFDTKKGYFGMCTICYPARECEVGECSSIASVYAMGKNSGDWGGYYCSQHIPASFIIVDRF